MRRANPLQAAESEEEMKQRTIVSVFYLILLQMTGYFDAAASGGSRPAPSLASIYQMKGKENDATLSAAELHVGALLERIIAATAFCTTEVCHFEMAGGAEWTAGKVTPVVGRTINATLALVQHSCYPTAARVCRENATLLIAQKNIARGEPVTINFAAPFYAATRSDRRQYLTTSGYDAACECDACRADWPLFDGLPPGPQGLADVERPAGGDLVGGGAVLPVGFRPVLQPSFSSNNNTTNINSNFSSCGGGMLTKTEQHVMETFNRVRSRIDQLQRSTSNRLPSDPPSKIMIQSQAGR